MNMEYPEEETMLQDYKDKDDDFINKEDVDWQECGNQAEIVDLWKYQNHSGINIINICN